MVLLRQWVGHFLSFGLRSLSLSFSVFFLPSFRAVSSSAPVLLPPFLTTLSAGYLVPLLLLPFPTRNGPFVSQGRKIIDVKKRSSGKNETLVRDQTKNCSLRDLDDVHGLGRNAFPPCGETNTFSSE